MRRHSLGAIPTCGLPTQLIRLAQWGGPTAQLLGFPGEDTLLATLHRVFKGLDVAAFEEKSATKERGQADEVPRENLARGPAKRYPGSIGWPTLASLG